MNDVNDVFPSTECLTKENNKWKFWKTSYNRFVALILIMIASFILSALFDEPGSMESIIQETFSVTPYQFEYLYSISSLPNIVMCFFSGLLMDKVLGLVKGSLIFLLIALTGQVIITVGGFVREYWILLLGRFIFGLGGETVAVAINCFIILWFEGKEVSLVFGLFQTITRLGTSAAFLLATPLHHFAENNVPKWAVFGISTIPFMIMAIIYATSLLALGYFTIKTNKINSQSNSEQIDFREIIRLPLILWIVILMLTLGNNAIFCFISCSQELLKKKYNVDDYEANYLSSFFNLFGAVASPIPGLIIDKYGNDVLFFLAGISVGMISLILMACTSWNPYIPLTLFAIFYTLLFSSGWPMVSRVVQPYQVTTAYGALQCFINTVGTVSNILTGYLVGMGPIPAILLFLSYLIAAFICCLIIWALDRKGDGILNMSASQRIELISRAISL